jgi:hypothetical protein
MAANCGSRTTAAHSGIILVEMDAQKSSKRELYSRVTTVSAAPNPV